MELGGLKVEGRGGGSTPSTFQPLLSTFNPQLSRTFF
jgi:hypothetical protein